MGAAEQEWPRSVGRYVLFREVAHGGMATVHIGRLRGPAGFARTVAIKRLHPPFARDPEFVSMFLDEARLAARIQHPNVVSVLDVVAAEGELFLVMDYVQGESLSHLLKLARKASIEVPRRIYVTIICGMLTGLDAAHEARNESGQPLEIVHRDVSPQNVLLGLDGVPRVLDFGVAKASLRVHWSTKDGTLKGKIGYMPPEQITTGLVDRRADIYAAGVMLWEGLTGQRLFDTKKMDLQVVIARVLSGGIDPPSKLVPGIPKALDAVVLKALAGNREERYATARDMLVALERVMPPATTRHVGEWVSKVAGEALRARTVELTQIERVQLPASTSGNALDAVRPSSEREAIERDEESDSRSLPLRVDAHREKETVAPPRARLRSGQDLAHFVPRAAPPSAAPPSGDEEEIALDPDPSVRLPISGIPILDAPVAEAKVALEESGAIATPGEPPGEVATPVMRPTWPLWGAALALATVAAAGFLVFRAQARLPTTESTLPMASSPAPRQTDMNTVIAAPPPPLSATTEGASEATIPPPPASASGGPPAGGMPSAMVARPSHPGPTSKPQCSPPYTIDADGVRIPKRECFR